MKKYSGNKVGIFPIDYGKVFYKFPLPGMNKMTLGQKPPMKGGHTHNHLYNAYCRSVFRSKSQRKVDPKDKAYFVSVFLENLKLNKTRIVGVTFGGKDVKGKGKILQAQELPGREGEVV